MSEKTAPHPLLIVSANPHIKAPDTVGMIIWSVVAALLPATFMGIYYFGIDALLVCIAAISSSVFFEVLYRKLMRKRVTINDGSAVLTGLLLGLNLAPATPWYVPVIGSGVAIVLAKQLFGGIGLNIFNPALLGRLFLFVSFPKILTTFSAPLHTLGSADAISAATPLTMLRSAGMTKLIETYGSKTDLYLQLLLGNRGGCIGETAVIGLLIGALFLLYRGVITWHTPVSYLGTVAIVVALSGGDPVVHLLSGGLLLGAFFMATDYTTTPLTRRGKMLCGIACGTITALIRLKGGYPEGVMFSILIMNCFAPLLDTMVRRKPFGTTAAKS
ncbi:MAG: RnfABCDGE type electron transport complex subunit D [Chitinispirillaceae bacterium]|nr:RnfABCDGE type electron transport complex subunit D [Chitinispirillaceae bacterium]